MVNSGAIRMAIGGIRLCLFLRVWLVFFGRIDSNVLIITVAFVTEGKDYFYLTTIPRSYNF
jgi:hypothetical protein